MNREELIAQKGAVRAELARTQRDLEHTRTAVETASGLRRRYLRRRLAHLETRADALMSEEYRVRQLIDQSR